MLLAVILSLIRYCSCLNEQGTIVTIDRFASAFLLVLALGGLINTPTCH